MVRVRWYLYAIVCVVLVVCGCSMTRRTVWEDDTFRYQNPIVEGIDGGIRDAQIVRDGDTYYLIGTFPPFGPRDGADPVVKIYSSANLLEWSYEKLSIDPSAWHDDRLWAPEIKKIHDKYYLLFNYQNEQGTREQGQAGGVAVANHILGPYTVLTHDEPFHRGNHLTFFEDDDGKVYAFWSQEKCMQAAEVDMGTMKPIFPVGSSEPLVVLRPNPGTWDSIGIAGPSVVKRDGLYYMFYSSWSRGYETGYATAIHPLGPWIQFPGNPIYGIQDVEACKKNNLPYSGDPNSPFTVVGHNKVWTGPDGRFWFSCHGIVYDQEPSLVIDPIWFDEEDLIHAEGPTYTPQEVVLRTRRLGVF